MSAGLVAVIVIAAVLVCVAVGLVWWVNRPLPLDREYARQTLPLFGSETIIDEVWIDDEEDEEDSSQVRRVENVARSGTAGSAGLRETVVDEPVAGAERRAHRFAPPAGASPVSSMQAPRAPEARPDRNADAREQPEHARPVADDAPVAAPVATTKSNNGHPVSHPAGDTGLRHTRQSSGWNARATNAAPRAMPSKQGHAALQTPPVAMNAVVNAASETPAAVGETFEGKSVTFSVPTDGTLQFLPGRLEITAGKDLGREVRFVRVPGINTPRVTFGRVDGPMYRHVQLHDQTVSRKHATMELVDGEWTLTNLSTTNPVVHNERILGEGETQTLSEGDRIEMGEVVFRYRVR